MREISLSKLNLFLLIFFWSSYAFSQYGIIEMKNGDQFEMKSPGLHVDGDLLRYFIAEYKPKASILGFGYKKLKEEFLRKTKAVKISEIKKIHVEGELKSGSKSILDFIGIRYIKMKRKYKKFYVIEDGVCALLVIPEHGGNALFSYYVQTNNDEPYKIHQVGTAIGAKFRNRSKKYFADCAPAIDYIKSDLKRSTLPKLIQIYNANCAN